ncbi:serine/threonine-protein kinase [Streptomyces sp. NPDC057382]|uniref:serine/threonine-protein kinase n=1 Tax=unclassified Streptomyces TaxID=2593676 RepID=UPI003644DE59
MLRGCARILAGRYRLDALIGSGGAADVHRGFDLRLRRPVAVKVFRAGTGFDTEEALRSEAVILARLQHPGLVTAFDAGRHDGEAFLVMQLIDGPTLKSRIAEGPLPWQAAAGLGAALADALAHAHEADIVHRDVKPSNILLDSAGRPHLTDFGISRLLDATTRTATGTLTGTAAYLSPEQVLGRRVGQPADVYALGLVLLECLTGRLEYDGGPLEAAIARLHRPPVIPDFLPDAFASLLERMTSLEEGDRPTAGDCSRALTRLAGADTAGPAASTPQRALSVVPAVVTEEADSTHRSLPLVARASGASTAAPGAADAEARPAARPGRLRTGGVAAALAAVVAAGLVVTDGFSPHDASGEAAPSAPDRDSSSRTDDTAVLRDKGSSSAPATPSSGSPSVSARPVRDSGAERAADAPTSGSEPAGRPAPASLTAERPPSEKPLKEEVAKGEPAAQGQPPAHARARSKGKKPAHAR